jgi:K+:H+ antiporter
VVVATAGKFGGTTIAARASGLGWRDSGALGILMNTRGLVELIVLNIGLDLGVITPRLFTMLVIMALVTTMMTSPILSTLLRPSKR